MRTWSAANGVYGAGSGVASCAGSLAGLHGAVSSTRTPSGWRARGVHTTRPLSQAPKRDYYDILGVSRGADKKEIKRKYYELAKKYHPDANKEDPSAAEKFAEVQHAYEVLSDEEKRDRYDAYGHDAEQMGFDGGFGGGGGFGGQGMRPEDVFREFFGGGGGSPFEGFGGGGRPTGPVRGGDVQVGLVLSFMEAVHGCSPEVQVTTDVECKPCAGTGSADKTDPVTCSTCGGSGQVTRQQGFFTMAIPCAACGGSGQTIANPCRSCSGNGVQKERRTVQVTVPPGVDSGVNLRLPNQGDKGRRGGPAGHMYVTIQVRPDPFFRRDGADVHVELPLKLSQAVLGDHVTIPTLTGEAELKVPPGTQPADTLVMRNKGIRRLNSSSHGHQYVHFKLQIPKTLTEKQRKAIEEFAEDENDAEDKSNFLGSTMERIKRALGKLGKSDDS